MREQYYQPYQGPPPMYYPHPQYPYAYGPPPPEVHIRGGPPQGMTNANHSAANCMRGLHPAILCVQCFGCCVARPFDIMKKLVNMTAHLLTRMCMQPIASSKPDEMDLSKTRHRHVNQIYFR
eukprot:GHVO01028215.1.p1 GENE.GHVO01028215.1~~GHVO01028215.1.p1  ORF type:complete len:122 (-),score=20.68 GHVO01028215.1:39-404(-)